MDRVAEFRNNNAKRDRDRAAIRDARIAEARARQAAVAQERQRRTAKEDTEWERIIKQAENDAKTHEGKNFWPSVASKMVEAGEAKSRKKSRKKSKKPRKSKKHSRKKRRASRKRKSRK